MNKNFYNDNRSDMTVYSIGFENWRTEIQSDTRETNYNLSPVRVSFSNNDINFKIERIYCSFEITIIVTTAQEVLMIARGKLSPIPMSEQTRNETKHLKVLNVALCDTLCVILYSNHRVYGYGAKVEQAFPFPNGTGLLTRISHEEQGDIVYCTVGYYHTYMINSKHQVFSKGSSQGLGRSSESSDWLVTFDALSHDDYIIKVSAGYSQLIALSKQGYAFFTGYGSHGEGMKSQINYKYTKI
jgi:alpha-tubulin suppressor-like RCC1 family protein